MPYVKVNGKLKYRDPNKPLKPDETPAVIPTDKPVTSTLKSTGETRTDVKNPKTGAFESTFTPTELAASKAIVQGKQQRAIEDEILKQGGAIPTKEGETTPLPKEQVKTTGLLTPEQNLGTTGLESQNKPFLENVRKTVMPGLPPQKTPRETVGDLFKSAIIALDAFKTAVSGKDPKTIQNTENTLDENKGTIELALDQLAAGNISPIEIEYLLNDYEAAINALESENKRVADIYVSYRKLGGQNRVLIKIEKQRRYLQSVRQSIPDLTAQAAANKRQQQLRELTGGVI